MASRGWQQIIILGNLGADPELKMTPTNKAVCTFSVAVNEKWGEGDNQQSTEWFSVVAWEKRAETIAKYLKKGRQVQIIGKIKTQKWEDKDTGQNRERKEIVLTDFTFCDAPSEESFSSDSSGSKKAADEASNNDDLPF